MVRKPQPASKILPQSAQKTKPGCATGLNPPKPDAWSDVSFHQEVRRNLKGGICHGKQGYCYRISIRRRVCPLQNVVACLLVHDPRSTNVATIKIIEQVDEAAEWQQSKVDFPSQPATPFLVLHERGLL
jgi:hypothetical protein